MGTMAFDDVGGVVVRGNEFDSFPPFSSGQGSITNVDVVCGMVKSSPVRAGYLSEGVGYNIRGISSIIPDDLATCFHRVCAGLGVSVPYWACRVCDISEVALGALRAQNKYAKVYYIYYGLHDIRNHLILVDGFSNSSTIHARPLANYKGGSDLPIVGVTSLTQFFDSKNGYARIEFYSGTDDPGFGSDKQGRTFDVQPNMDVSQSRPDVRSREQSVSVPGSRSGTANITGGVVRPKRRVVASKLIFNPTGVVSRAYNVSGGVQFNNLEEMFLDTISPALAQEIMEMLFEQWQINVDDPVATKFAEDLVFAFLVATTASNKADYSKEFEVPQMGGTVTVSFDTLSRVLATHFGVTRRQFARGIADRLRAFIRADENVQLLPMLASRMGCDPQMASLVFDGSTHCTNLSSHELSFTKLLETRNLFEDASMLSEGSSKQLMQGMSSGPRSMVSR